MNNEDNTNYGIDVRLLCEFLQGQDRQGPGSVEMTLKALGFIEGLDERSRMVDIACGTGGQTLTLARHTTGRITAIDNYPGFIDKLNREADRLHLRDRLQGMVGTMEKLPFEEESLDLIWCEGAIYNIGFERGIREWRPFLKEEGYLAVSESCWFTEERPAEIHDFWMDGYPEISTISVKVEQLQKAGYLPVATFVLPTYCWQENYYQPLAAMRQSFLDAHPGNKSAEELIRFCQLEEDMYRRYKDYYGYVFFVAKKR